MDISNIALGFLNATRHEFGVSNPMVEEVAQERYIVCLSCPLISDDKRRCDKNKCVGDKCGCNCWLGWKCRSNSQCPLSKW
jgi:hypothetical protein